MHADECLYKEQISARETGICVEIEECTEVMKLMNVLCVLMNHIQVRTIRKRQSYGKMAAADSDQQAVDAGLYSKSTPISAANNDHIEVADSCIS